MRILIANDDGIHSNYTRRMAEYLLQSEYVTELIAVCPLEERSGVGHAFTFFKPLEVHPIDNYPCQAFAVSGMPSDCVKYAVDQIYGDSLPDLVISGPNHGLNAGVAVFYSGTLAAAREGALWGIPSLALSIPYDQPQMIEVVLEWLGEALIEGRFKQIQPGSVWNVNFPSVDLLQTPLKTVVCSMGETMYEDNYHLHSSDEVQTWILKGEKPKALFQPGTDDWHLEKGEITLVPLQIAQTHTTELIRLREFWTTKDSQ